EESSEVESSEQPEADSRYRTRGRRASTRPMRSSRIKSYNERESRRGRRNLPARMTSSTRREGGMVATTYDYVPTVPEGVKGPSPEELRAERERVQKEATERVTKFLTKKAKKGKGRTPYGHEGAESSDGEESPGSDDTTHLFKDAERAYRWRTSRGYVSRRILREKGLDPDKVMQDKAGAKRVLSGDANPLLVDASMGFEEVGGCADHVRALKEMVFLPLVSPKLFADLGVKPPRGVLFHGPPGTGKTLIARALASQCSRAGQRVAFFMRNGADILSKYVGEAEKQLRILFDDAKNQQPAIIFFDEIDGLCPVRSSKTENQHASVVATLLALMDGLEDRGQVIVIGATNRPDAIDPALRRPGRFDRELQFRLPSCSERRQILKIHTRRWTNQPSDETFDRLAEATQGYSGADLSALVSESLLGALRRSLPGVYSGRNECPDASKVQVTMTDYNTAMGTMVPTQQRSTESVSAPLPPMLHPILGRGVTQLGGLIQSLVASFSNRSGVTPYVGITGGTGDERSDDPELVTRAALGMCDALSTHVISASALSTHGLGPLAAVADIVSDCLSASPSALLLSSSVYTSSPDLAESVGMAVSQLIPRGARVVVLCVGPWAQAVKTHVNFSVKYDTDSAALEACGQVMLTGALRQVYALAPTLDAEAEAEAEGEDITLKQQPEQKEEPAPEGDTWRQSWFQDEDRIRTLKALRIGLRDTLIKVVGGNKRYRIFDHVPEDPDVSHMAYSEMTRVGTDNKWVKVDDTEVDVEVDVVMPVEHWHNNQTDGEEP
ncbi:hypothetical protein KIPB_007466, partial [Kipferlia bialata]